MGRQAKWATFLMLSLLGVGAVSARAAGEDSDSATRKPAIKRMHRAERATLKKLAKNPDSLDFRRAQVRLTILESYAKGAKGVKRVRTVGDLKQRRARVLASIEELKARSARNPSSAATSAQITGKLNWFNEELGLIDALIAGKAPASTRKKAAAAAAAKPPTQKAAPAP